MSLIRSLAHTRSRHRLTAAHRTRAAVSAAVAAALALTMSGTLSGRASAAAGAQHLAVPAYFNPSDAAGRAFWTQIDQAGSRVGIAVANPSNGPGTAVDSGYASAVSAAAGAGAKVLGYVDTGYFGTTGRTTRGGQTSVAAWTAQINADVANWYSWYGSSGLAGIFFDDALGDCGSGNAHVNLYSGINSTTKQAHPGALTVDNPGSPAESCYASAADVLVMFENTYSVYASWTAPDWELNYANPDKFWHLVYDTPAQADMENAVALSKQRNAGYLYVTPDNLPNPWDTLPTGAYWSDELAKAAAAGSGGSGGTGGSGGGTGCTTTAGSGAITSYSACASAGTAVFKATFNSSESFHHVFINTDGNTATGYQAPAPSSSPLGADYMIENGSLYRSTSTGWAWAAATPAPTTTISGSTYTWTLPLTALGSPRGTQQVEFNAGTAYTPVVSFSAG
ncbi:spherulation-specific family 4 protein [Streptomyces sp. NPDC003300]|uniref:spherulation-specific family 4 protein n=1 Tax=unclassified Streptomyces TaxID=2593676 RepID=UPI0033B4EADC